MLNNNFTHNKNFKKNWLKFVLGFTLCFLVRIIPFRPPNIEPILAMEMPFSRAYGPYTGFLFAFFSIVLFDLITQKFGMWTLLTAVTYGMLGIWATFYFKRKEGGPLDYARFAIIGTLFFDAVTGLSLGPLFFGQSFAEAFFGQIPFTLWHLLGNVSFALVLSPALYRFVLENEKLEITGKLKIA